MSHKGLGKHYRKGITLIEIFRMFPDDATAEKWFTDVRWPDGVHCPHCGSDNVQTGAKHKTMPLRCRNYKDCGKKFSVKTETVMEGSNLGYQVWAVATYLLTTSLKGVTSMKLHRNLGVTQTTAWFLARRIRDSFKADNQNFNGVIEADDFYFGELKKKKHWDKKLNKGWGTVGKTAISGLKDRDTNQVSAKVIENTKRGTLHGFINTTVEEGSTVCADNVKSYWNMQGCDHRFVKHSVGKYVDANNHINGMESYWCILNRAYEGKFHKISHKHLNRYVTEFVGRHNHRSFDNIEQMKCIVLGMVGKRPRYEELTSGNGAISVANP